MLTRYKHFKTHHPSATRAIYTAIMVVFLLILIAPRALAQDSNQIADCSSNGTNFAYCAPAGRWGSLLGNINTRIEPASNIQDVGLMASNLGVSFAQTFSNILLSIAQIPWTIAIAVNTFAMDFDASSLIGQPINAFASSLATGVVSGGSALVALITLALVVTAISGGVFRAVSGNIFIKTLTSFLCIAFVSVIGVQSAKDPSTGADGKLEPPVMSAWWVTKQFDVLSSNILNGIDFTQGFSSSDQLMDGSIGNTKSFSCGEYITAMNKQTKDALKGHNGPVNIMGAISTSWQETQLRAWVTAQFGNPNAGGDTTQDMAENARYAYCHVLEAMAGTPTNIQKDLTNTSTQSKASITESTATRLFTPEGFLDPWNRVVTPDNDKPFDRAVNVKLARMAVFWQACGIDKNSGNVYVRSGWNKALGGLNREGVGDIWNGKSPTRAGETSSKNVSADTSLWSIVKSDKSGEDAGQARTQTACQVMLKPSDEAQKKIFEPQEGVKNKTNLVAGTLGWLFDLPNTAQAFNETHLTDVSAPNPQNGQPDKSEDARRYAVKKTLDLQYSGTGRNLTPAMAGIVPSIIVCAIYVMMGMVYAGSKIMLYVTGLFGMLSLILQAIPVVNEIFNSPLRQWAKKTFNLSLVGGLYTLMNGLVLMFTNVFLTLGVATANSGMFPFLVGLAPVMAIAGLKFAFKMWGVADPFTMANFKSATGVNMVGQVMSKGANAVKDTVRGVHNHQRAKQLGLSRAERMQQWAGVNVEQEKYRDRRTLKEDQLQAQREAENEQTLQMAGERAEESTKLHDGLQSQYADKKKDIENAEKEFETKYHGNEDEYMMAYGKSYTDSKTQMEEELGHISGKLTRAQADYNMYNQQRFMAEMKHNAREQVQSAQSVSHRKSSAGGKNAHTGQDSESQTKLRAQVANLARQAQQTVKSAASIPKAHVDKAFDNTVGEATRHMEKAVDNTVGQAVRNTALRLHAASEKLRETNERLDNRAQQIRQPDAGHGAHSTEEK